MIARVLLLWLWLCPAWAGGVDYADVIDTLAARGDALVAAYRPEQGQDTAAAFTDLYFKVFEASGIELALGARDSGALKRLESDFGAVVAEAMRGGDKPALEARWHKLRAGLLLARAGLAQAESGFVSVALQSMLILLREGFEAILVVTALLAYLRRVGARDKTRHVHAGAIAGLIASAVAAVVLIRLVQSAGSLREGIEGFTLLAAAAVLFYLSYWLFAKREAARWKEYVEGQLRAALTRGSMAALAFAAFLAVFREGAETVLFYNALAAGHPGQAGAIAAGIAVASALLFGLYAAMRTASVRLPFGLFFGATAALLYALAIVFAGQGVLELQGAGLLRATPLDGVPTIAWLGIFPSREGLLAQGLLLLALAPVAWVSRKKAAADATTAQASG